MKNSPAIFLLQLGGGTKQFACRSGPVSLLKFGESRMFFLAQKRFPRSRKANLKIFLL